MDRDSALRDHVARFLAWEDAHPDFEAAVKGIAPSFRGAAAPGLPHTLWQLLQHLRVTQRDILDFCVAPKYEEMKWPDDYWPKTPAPGSDAEWERSITVFREDRDELAALARDPRVDLLARVPNGTGQTFLRELLLVADHNAYHIGQMVLVRRALGIWG